MLIKYIHTCNIALCTQYMSYMHIQEEQGDYLLVLTGSREVAVVKWWNGLVAVDVAWNICKVEEIFWLQRNTNATVGAAL